MVSPTSRTLCSPALTIQRFNDSRGKSLSARRFRDSSLKDNQGQWLRGSVKAFGVSAAKFEILVLTSAGTTTLRRMSKAGKLAAKILSGKSDKNFAFSDLCYILDRAGFQLRPGKGHQHSTTQWKSKAVSSKTGARTAFEV